MSDDFNWPTIGDLKDYLEPEVEAWISQRVRETDVVWDLGANIGNVSRIARKHTKSWIVAVEANPATFKVLAENLEPPGAAICGALWSGDGRYLMNLDLFENSGTTMITEDGYQPQADAGWYRPNEHHVRPVEVWVPRLTMKDIMQKIAAPDVVKLDVEGAELHVLQGAEGALYRCHTLIVEVIPKTLQYYGHRTSDLCEFIGSELGLKKTDQHLNNWLFTKEESE